jgi:hypothetical protein
MSDGNIDGGKYSCDEAIAAILFVIDTHATSEVLRQIRTEGLSNGTVCVREKALYSTIRRIFMAPCRTGSPRRGNTSHVDDETPIIQPYPFEFLRLLQTPSFFQRTTSIDDDDKNDAETKLPVDAAEVI